MTTTARGSLRAASAARTAATSPCPTTATRARDNRQASTIEAWLPASETTRAPGPDRAVSAPRLAAYPEEKTSARGAARKAASSVSSSACSWVLPVTRREPVEPAPHVRSAVTPASTTRGSRARPR